MEKLAAGGPPEKARKCIVLLSSDPPETALITVPAEALHLFPKTPVDW
jgi:hypothetical protein